MMKYLRVPAITLLFIIGFGYAIKMPTHTRQLTYVGGVEFKEKTLERHVKVLSEDLTPRTCESPVELRNATNYIQNRFQETNPDTYLQDYEIRGNSFANIISNYGPDTREIIIVGAHYDAYASFPGADDNASGVAGLLELGRVLSTEKLKKRIVLVAYACEEPPYFAGPGMGSYIHANSIRDKDVTLMISLEMIGFFTSKPDSQDFPVPALSLLYPEQGDYVAIIGKLLGTEASSLKSTINAYTSVAAYSINAPVSLRGVDYSDHRNYWALDYPAVMITDTSFYRNKNYHTAGDTYDKLDYRKMKEIVLGVYIHIVELANKT